MSNQSERETALRNWIIGVTGLPEEKVIRQNRGGNKPGGDFITFSPLIIVDRHGHNFVSSEDVGGGEIKTTHTSIQSVRTTVEIYSLDGADYAEMLALSPGTYQHRFALSQGDLTYAFVTAGNWIPSFLDTGPEDRFIVSFTFITQFDLEETDHELLTMTVTGKLIKPDDTEIPVQLSLDFT